MISSSFFISLTSIPEFSTMHTLCIMGVQYIFTDFFGSRYHLLSSYSVPVSLYIYCHI
jgi:hypothetical protein